MSNEGKDDHPAGMDPRDDEALWQLLGRAKGVEASPYFARRVLREVTLAGEAPHAAGGWLAGVRRLLRGPRAAVVWPGAVIVAGFWLAVVMTTPPAGPGRAGGHSWQTPPDAGESAAMADTAVVDAHDAVTEEVALQDVEVIADLDNMIAREENRLWTEDTARF